MREELGVRAELLAVEVARALAEVVLCKTFFGLPLRS